MNNYNPNKHHRRSIRLQGYDYSQAGLYFVTMCCKDRTCLFGEIINGKMILNDFGKIAEQCWLEIPTHFPNAELHEFVIMPNHVHGIIEFVNDVNVGAENVVVGDFVGAENFLPLLRNPQRNEFQKMIPRSIGSIVKGFKIGVTKWLRNEWPENFPTQRQIWQRNYHEHIIRNEQSYHNISDYIKNNPAKWVDDEFHHKRIE